MSCDKCLSKIDEVVEVGYPAFKDNKKIKFSDFYNENIYTWCTNCGNYGIHGAMKRALVEEGVAPKDSLLCFDIGCNGNGSDKIDGYRFHGLHGRVIPFASGAALANRRLTVIASGGDGATMGEGVNHLVHAIRSNYDITFILHNNSNYGLTTGQASATTKQGAVRTFAPEGSAESTINVAQFVLSLNPTFYARGFSGNINQLTALIRKGIQHKGFSFIEVLQNCPTYNKETPHEWYMQRVYDVVGLSGYDFTDIDCARDISRDLENRIATGVIYQDKGRVDYYNKLLSRVGAKTELVDEVKAYDIKSFIERYK